MIGIVGGWERDEPQLEVEFQVGGLADLGRYRMGVVEGRRTRRHPSQSVAEASLIAEFGRDLSGGGGLMVPLGQPVMVRSTPYTQAQERIEVLQLTLPCYGLLVVTRWVRRDGSIGIARLPWTMGVLAISEPDRLSSVRVARAAARHARRWAFECGQDKQQQLEMFRAKLDWYREHPSQAKTVTAAR
jgi:hypothetical protein